MASQRRSHARNLASVGSADSLFGSAGGSNDSSPDFFNQLQQPDSTSSSQHGYSYQQQPFQTVPEEEEPEQSPVMGRGQPFDTGRSGDVATNTFGNHAAGDDWYSGGQQGYQQQQHNGDYSNQYASHHDNYATASADGGGGGVEEQQNDGWEEPPYYAGFIYDRASNSYLPDPNTSDDPALHQQSSQSWDSYDNQSYTHSEGGHQTAGDASTAQDGDYVEPPYYAGYRYDPVSNSYLPDESYAPEASAFQDDAQAQNHEQPTNDLDYQHHSESQSYGDYNYDQSAISHEPSLNTAVPSGDVQSYDAPSTSANGHDPYSYSTTNFDQQQSLESIAEPVSAEDEPADNYQSAAKAEESSTFEYSHPEATSFDQTSSELTHAEFNYDQQDDFVDEESVFDQQGAGEEEGDAWGLSVADDEGGYDHAPVEAARPADQDYYSQYQPEQAQYGSEASQGGSEQRHEELVNDGALLSDTVFPSQGASSGRPQPDYYDRPASEETGAQHASLPHSGAAPSRGQYNDEFDLESASAVSEVDEDAWDVGAGEPEDVGVYDTDATHDAASQGASAIQPSPPPAGLAPSTSAQSDSAPLSPPPPANEARARVLALAQAREPNEEPTEPTDGDEVGSDAGSDAWGLDGDAAIEEDGLAPSAPASAQRSEAGTTSARQSVDYAPPRAPTPPAAHVAPRQEFQSKPITAPPEPRRSSTTFPSSRTSASAPFSASTTTSRPPPITPPSEQTSRPDHVDLRGSLTEAAAVVAAAQAVLAKSPPPHSRQTSGGSLRGLRSPPMSAAGAGPPQFPSPPQPARGFASTQPAQAAKVPPPVQEAEAPPPPPSTAAPPPTGVLPPPRAKAVAPPPPPQGGAARSSSLTPRKKGPTYALPPQAAAYSAPPKASNESRQMASEHSQVAATASVGSPTSSVAEPTSRTSSAAQTPRSPARSAFSPPPVTTRRTSTSSQTSAASASSHPQGETSILPPPAQSTVSPPAPPRSVLSPPPRSVLSPPPRSALSPPPSAAAQALSRVQAPKKRGPKYAAPPPSVYAPPTKVQTVQEGVAESTTSVTSEASSAAPPQSRAFSPPSRSTPSSFRPTPVADSIDRILTPSTHQPMSTPEIIEPAAPLPSRTVVSPPPVQLRTLSSSSRRSSVTSPPPAVARKALASQPPPPPSGQSDAPLPVQAVPPPPSASSSVPPRARAPGPKKPAYAPPPLAVSAQTKQQIYAPAPPRVIPPTLQTAPPPAPPVQRSVPPVSTVVPPIVAVHSPSPSSKPHLDLTSPTSRETYNPQPPAPSDSPSIAAGPVEAIVEEDEHEYGFDEAQVFDTTESVMSPSTSGSGYGDWTGESEAAQGYDYVGGEYGYGESASQEPFEASLADPYALSTQTRDPYAPSDAPSSRRSSQDPAGQAADSFDSPNFGYTPRAQQDGFDAPPATNYAPPPSSQFAPPPTNQYAPPPSRQHAPPPRTFTPNQSPRPGVQSSPTKRAGPTYGSPPKQAARPPPRPQVKSMYQSYTPNDYAPQAQNPHGPQSTGAPQDGYAPYGSYDQPVTPGADLTSDPYAQHDPYRSTQADNFLSTPAAELNGQRRHSYDDTITAQDPYSAGNAYGSYDRSSTATPFGGPQVDLGLDRCDAPIISSGFGGRMLLVFPAEPPSAYGMDTYSAVPTVASTPTTVHIRKVADMYAATESTSFPGPIFMDGGKSNAGKKRKEAVTWLEHRIVELDQELHYLRAGPPPSSYGAPPPQETAGDAEKVRKASSRLVLIKLVKALVENEGKLSGTPKLDELIRSILVPHAAAPESFDNLPLASDLAGAASQGPTGSDAPIATYSVSGTNLDEITTLLLRGERRKAVRYALDNKMWAHAFVISSCVDTDCWKDVVSEFLRSELASKPEPNGSNEGNGREGLRVAYSMFAGFGAESAQQWVPPRPLTLAPSLLPPHLLSVGSSSLIPRAPSPISPSFGDQSTPASDLPDSVLEKWQETAALIIANRTSGDSAALTALGDSLRANGWLDAAHVCYLLSPTSSPIGGAGMPGVRISLVGGEAPVAASTTGIDLESIMLTELVEFAFSLMPAIKGQEPFVGFPHLQALRLYHATRLADSGQVSQAQRYTDAIGNTIKLATKPSPFYHSRLVAQVKALSDRLSASPGVDKGGSWIARKVPKPTIEGVWTTLEGRFTKFVAGEGDHAAQEQAAKAEYAKSIAASGGAVGPFSHYSSIAPGSTSGALSRTPSQVDLNTSHIPSRPTSAAGVPPPSAALGAGPPPVKRAPFKTHHARSSSLGFAGYNYDPNAPPPWQSYARNPTEDATPKAAGQEFSQEQTKSDYSALSAYASTNGANSEAGGNGQPDWYSRNELGDSTSTLRPPTFAAVDQSFTEDESGFISPMAAYTPAVSPNPTQAYVPANNQHVHRRTTTRDELDDLGLGNSKPRKPQFDAIDESGNESEEAEGDVKGKAKATEGLKPPAAGPAQPEKPAIKPSRSWIGGWFKREASPGPSGPAAVKANLGEQSAFVFDPELKRWVNRKGGESAAPLATAPPPRASTASPSRAMRGGQPASFGDVPPVPSMPTSGRTSAPPMSSIPPPPLSRARTMADLNGGAPPPGPPRSFSTGPPPPAISRPSSAGGMGPPISRPPSANSGASTPAGGRRKPLASRYVVVPP